MFIISAHYNMKWSSRVADLVNDRQLAGATNLILLQVTATPYSLVTANSRYTLWETWGGQTDIISTLHYRQRANTSLLSED